MCTHWISILGSSESICVYFLFMVLSQIDIYEHIRWITGSLHRVNCLRSSDTDYWIAHRVDVYLFNLIVDCLINTLSRFVYTSSAKFFGGNKKETPGNNTELAAAKKPGSFAFKVLALHGRTSHQRKREPYFCFFK